SRTSGVLALSGVVWGIGVGILYPHLTALSVHRVRARDKGKVLGLFASSVDLGFALGPLGFGWLSQAVGIRAAFWPLGLFLFFSSLILIPVGRGSFPDVSIERTG
ncbi:MAG: MFS transporter, partial [Candidatus Aminicenantales bacterium]